MCGACSGLSSGVAEPLSVADNGDGTHTVNYTPANDGPYTVCVKYADQEVPRRFVLTEWTYEQMGPPEPDVTHPTVFSQSF